MESQRKAVKIALILGIFLFPLFGLLDLAVYPDFLKQLLAIRLAIAVYLALSLFIINKIQERHLFLVAFSSFLLSSFSISLMCFITGEGLASPYYAGHFLVIIIACLFFPMKKRYYTVIVMGSFVQHFTLLSFLPWQISDLAINVFFLGGVLFSGWIVRKFIYNLLTEIKTLQGIIPICSHCKKIRNDKGYWDQVEYYISEHSGAQFSHSICPNCTKQLYGDILDYHSDKS